MCFHCTIPLRHGSETTIRMGYLQPHTIDASAMVADVEDRLLAAVSSCSNHVLRPIFPPLIERRPGLRPRPHNFTLPDKDDTNFTPRVLYRALTHWTLSVLP